MKSQDAIRTLIDSSSMWSQNKLGAALGLTNQAMYERMAAKDVKASFLASAAAQFGCKLVIVPPQTELPKGSIVIDGME